MIGNSTGGGTTISSAPTPTSLGTFTELHMSSFVAQETIVLIQCKSSMQSVKGIGGTYGPFNSNSDVRVPLWVALLLRASESCTIYPPAFLGVPFLSELLKKELESDSEFQQLEFYFFEVAFQLLKYAEFDIPRATEVLRLVNEIQQTRKRKMMLVMQRLPLFNRTQMTVNAALKVTLCSSELHMLRASLAAGFDDASTYEALGQPTAAALMAMRAVQQHTPARPSDLVTTIARTEDSESTRSGQRPHLTPGGDDGVASSAMDIQPVELQYGEANIIPPESVSVPGARKRRTLRQQ